MVLALTQKKVQVNGSLVGARNRISFVPSLTFPRVRCHGPSLAVLGGAFVVVSFMGASNAEARPPLSLKEIIEAKHVVPQRGATVVYNKARSYAFVVTRKGVLANNTTVYQLDVFSLERGGNAPPPVRVAGHVSITRKNEPGIHSATWDKDGKTVLFVASDEKDIRQVYSISAVAERATQLTRAAGDVEKFDCAGRLCVYLSRVPLADASHPDVPNFVGDHQQWWELAIPGAHPFDLAYAFYAQKRGMPEPPRQLTMPQRSVWLDAVTISVSPDASRAIFSKPVEAVPAHWRGYVAPRVWGVETKTQLTYWYLQFQLVDLVSNNTGPLLDAPTSWAIRHTSPPVISWTDDSSSAFVSDAMLPLKGKEDKTAGPWVIRYDVASRKVDPVLPQIASNEVYRRIHAISAISPAHVQVSFQPIDGMVRYESLSEDKLGQWRTLHRPPSGKSSRFENEFRVREGSSDPPALVNRSAGREHLVEDLNPSLRNKAHPIRQEITWKDAAGRIWRGLLIYPNSYRRGKRYPLVIELKDYDPAAYQPSGPYTTGFPTEALSFEGFFILRMNTIERYDMRTSSEAVARMQGVEAIVDRLSLEEKADLNRIGLVGFSRTCYYVLYTLTHSKIDFSAAVLADGMLGTFASYGLVPRDTQADLVAVTGGPPLGNGMQQWITYAPDLNVDKIRTPILFQFSRATGLISGWNFYGRLRGLDKPVEALFIPDGSHELVRPLDRFKSSSSSYNWMLFWLSGIEQSHGANWRDEWRNYSTSNEALLLANRRPIRLPQSKPSR